MPMSTRTASPPGRSIRNFSNEGYHFGGPHSKGSSILGSIWGPPIRGNYQLELELDRGHEVLR